MAAIARWLAIGVVLMLMPMALADGPVPADALRMSVLLNGTWETCPVADPQRIPAEGWRPARVPALPLAEDGRPAGMWYRKSLNVPGEWLRSGRRIVLRLEKVGHYAAVYCNEQKVAEHWDQFTPIEADLSTHLRKGENQIVVLAHEAAGAFVRPGGALPDEQMRFAYRPAGQGPTQRNWVGIVGDVSLCWRPADAIGDVLVTTSFRQKTIQADIRLAGEVAGDVCRAVVLDGQKTVLELPAVEVKDGVARVMSPWQDFIAWNPPQMGEPKLYWLRVELLHEGKVVDRTFTRFGFREVWAEGNKLLLNGQRLFINGTYHPWLDPLTYNNDRRAIAQDLAAMQSAGINCLHGHWDDLGQATLDLCDEMGVLVVNAFYCDGQLAIKPEADERWPAWAMETAGAWAQATRGHPSIVAWRPFCALPKKVPTTTMSEWQRQVREVVRKQAPTAMMVDGSDIAGYSQGAVKQDGQPESASRMAEWSRNSRVPVLTNEIWASFTPFDAHAAFLRDYYRQAWDSGSAGFIVQHLPYCLPDPPFDVKWLSESGPGGRADGWMIKRRVNWCDETKPAWKPDQYGLLLRELTPTITGKEPRPFGGKSVGELLVRGAKPGMPLFLLPADQSIADACALMPAPDGTAWAIIATPGEYHLVQGDRAMPVTVAPQLTVCPSGYSAVQQVQFDR